MGGLAFFSLAVIMDTVVEATIIRRVECRMLKKLYDKSNILFAILWIVAYCVLMSLGDALSAMVGVEKSVTVVVGFLLSAVLWLF